MGIRLGDGAEGSPAEAQSAEVPVRSTRTARAVSHHKRSGWFSPWLAGWINLRAMFVYGANFFLLYPGLAVFLVGAPVSRCRRRLAR